MTTTAEQEARNMLERMGVNDAQSFTAGEVVELANLISFSKQAKDRSLEKELEAIAADAPFKDPDGIAERVLTASAGLGAYVKAEVSRRHSAAPSESVKQEAAVTAVVEAACAAILELSKEQVAEALKRIADRLDWCGKCKQIGCGGWCDVYTG